MSTTRAIALIGLVAAVAAATWAAWHLAGSPHAGIDDADISLAFGRNIAAGHGFVFNPSGPRVEGFTSLLWVLVCAGAFVLAARPAPVLIVVSVALLCVTVSGCALSPIARRRDDPRAVSVGWSLVIVVLLLTDERFVAWNTITLMDTVVWTCLLTLAAGATLSPAAPSERSDWTVAALIALMIFTRPEALAWGVIVIAAYSLRCADGSARARTLSHVMPAALAWLCSIAALTTFRVTYFGFPLPNTFYAKVSMSIAANLLAGGRYLFHYVTSGPVPFAAATATAASAAHVVGDRLRDRRTLALTVLATAAFLLPVVVGGDNFNGFRFYQTTFPIFVLMIVNALRSVLPRYVVLRDQLRLDTRLATAAIVLAGVFAAAQADAWRRLPERTGLVREFEIARDGRARGAEAEALFGGLASRPRIATITVGGLKIGYPGDVVDLVGLTDTRFAHHAGPRVDVPGHAAFDKSVFDAIGPDIVIPLVQVPNDLESMRRRNDFIDAVLRGLVTDPDFLRKYTLAEVGRDEPSGRRSLAGWYENGFLAVLGQDRHYAIVR